MLTIPESGTEESLSGQSHKPWDILARDHESPFYFYVPVAKASQDQHEQRDVGAARTLEIQYSALKEVARKKPQNEFEDDDFESNYAKTAIMYDLCMAKATQNPELLGALIHEYRTGSSFNGIFESFESGDEFWGSGKAGNGRKELGQIWKMVARDLSQELSLKKEVQVRVKLRDETADHIKYTQEENSYDVPLYIPQDQIAPFIKQSNGVNIWSQKKVKLTDISSCYRSKERKEVDLGFKSRDRKSDPLDPKPNPNLSPSPKSRAPLSQVLSQSEIQKITTTIKEFLGQSPQDASANNDQIIQNFKKSLKAQKSELVPPGPYQGIGAKITFVDDESGVKALRIDDIFSPEIQRFTDHTSRQILGNDFLKGKLITKVTDASGQEKSIVDLDPKQIASIFHGQGGIVFTIKDPSDGTPYKINCNRDNKSIFLAKTDDAGKITSGSQYDPQRDGLDQIPSAKDLDKAPQQPSRG